jgi:fermentation-respiration switch protein FrsA (DUF1100 family)
VKVIKLSVSLAIAVYLLLVGWFFAMQRSLLYYPSHRNVALSEAHANPAFREVPVKTADGIGLKAWYAPSTSPPCTIVFFHGNADSLYTAAQIADPYIAAGYGFLLAEYRGYSGLPGKPTEKGLYEDARTYVQYLAAQGVPNQNVILFGHSLGTGVATEMAKEFRVGGLMLLAPYKSIPAVARSHFPFLPVSLIVLDRYENDGKIADVHTPLLIASGSIDDVIPPSQGKDLYVLAKEPKEFHSIAGRGHNDAFGDFAPISIDWINRACNPH